MDRNQNGPGLQSEAFLDHIIVLPIENYTFNPMFNHNFMIYNDKYQYTLSQV